MGTPRRLFVSPPASSGTALVAELRFDGLPQDYLHRPSGIISPNWYDSGALFPSITGLQPASNDCVGDTDPQGDKIITGASRTGAAGDRGYRREYGTGTNAQGGDLYYTIPGGPYRELWMKWWQRYAADLRPTSAGGVGNGAWTYNKDMAFNNDNNPNDCRIEIGQSQGAVGSYFGCWGVALTDSASRHLETNLLPPWPNCLTWNMQQGGDVGSGLFNEYQIHVKMGDGVDNGVCEMWFNGSYVANHTDVNYSTGMASHTGWRSIRIGNNQSGIGTDSGGKYCDYDDILLSTVGYITQD